MTQNQIDSVIRSMAETKAMIAKEKAFPAHLQKSEQISFLSGHMNKLRSMLEQNAMATYLAN